MPLLFSQNYTSTIRVVCAQGRTLLSARVGLPNTHALNHWLPVDG